MTRLPANDQIKSALERVRNAHPRIVSLSENDLDRLLSACDRYRKTDRTIYRAVIGALFLLASVPWLLHRQYEIAMSLAHTILSNMPDSSYFERNWYINISLGCLFFAVPLYLFDFSSWAGQILGAKQRPELSLPQFDRSEFRFWLFAMTLLMGWVFIPLIYVTVFGLASSSLAEQLWIICLMLPAPIFSVLPTFSLLLLLSLLVAHFFPRLTNKRSETIPGVIACRAILLLDKLDGMDAGRVTHEGQRLRIASAIGEIASLIKSLEDAWGEGQAVERFTRHQFERASRSVLSLKLAIALPDDKSFCTLQMRLGSIANVFLSGHLRNLPKVNYELFDETPTARRISFLRTAMSLVALGMFLALPLVVWAGVIRFFHPAVDQSVESLLPILYSIWCVVGVLSVSERLAPEARTIISETINILLSRK